MFYQESKTAKAAAIGTIMPWGGGITGIPDGWIPCDGTSRLASSFPLLTQAIGDTYNMGTTDLGGNFPSYSGSIRLPDLNGKALIDMETDYMIGGGSPTGRNADEDADAKTLLSPLIGTHESQSIVTAPTNVFTDIVFTIPSDQLNAGAGYQGKITGNTIFTGSGTQTLYVAPRKLGRKHVRRHNHSGNIETLRNGYKPAPGLGVVPYHEVKYTLRFQAIDNRWDDNDGETYYFGWTNDTDGGDDREGATSFKRPGIQVGGTSDGEGWAGYPVGSASGSLPAPPTGPTTTGYGSTTHLYQLWWPDTNAADTPNGFTNQGVANKVVGKIESTPPPLGLSPMGLMKTPITEKFLTTSTRPSGYRVDMNNPPPFGLGGGAVTIPSGFRNYYFDANITTLPHQPGTSITPESVNQVRNTMMSHPGYNFINGPTVPQDYIGWHDHDDIEVTWDGSRLKPKSSITATVNLPVQTDLLSNSANKNALQIDFNISQPKMVCMYIIRAY